MSTSEGVVELDPKKPLLHSMWNVRVVPKPFPIPVISVIGRIPLPNEPVYCPTTRIEGDIGKVAKDHFDCINSESPCISCYEGNRCCNSKYGNLH